MIILSDVHEQASVRYTGIQWDMLIDRVGGEDRCIAMIYDIWWE